MAKRCRFQIRFYEAIPMTCKKYIFDFESAVANTSECYKKAFSEAFSHFNIPFDEDKVEAYMNAPLDKTFEKYYRGCTCRFRDFVTMFVGCFDGSFELCVPRPGTVDLIRELYGEGHEIVVVSETYRFYVERFLTRYDLSKMISDIRSSEMTENKECVLKKMISDPNSSEYEVMVIDRCPDRNKNDDSEKDRFGS